MSLPTYERFNRVMEAYRSGGTINMFDMPKILMRRYKGLTKFQAEGLTSLWVFGKMDYQSFNDIIFERNKTW